MSIPYDLALNKLTTPASYNPRVRPRATVDTAALAAAIASTSSLSEGDVRAVLIALSAQVQVQLLAGNQVQIDGLGILSTSLRGRVPTPIAPLPEDTTIEIGFRADAPLRKAIQTGAELVRLDPTNLAPLLLTLNAATGGGLGNCSPGDILRLEGDRLKIKETALDEGVFLTDSTSTVHRVVNYLENGEKQLLFALPATLAPTTSYMLSVSNRRKDSLLLRTSQ